jgi:tRNA A-37 threonylcarbamoyl transferase component Bud32
MMVQATGPSSHETTHIAFFRGVLHDLRQVMTETYDLRRVSVRPIGAEGARLSIPVKISGVHPTGQRARYFGKILGSNDILSDRSMQFVKNLYLQMNAQDPIFGFTETAEDMARQQFQSLHAIFEAGIPTAKPLGYHPIREGTWLLVAEFLGSRSVSDSTECSAEQVDTLFGYLQRLHRKGIFHGDIKPQNIMLGDRIYILDAGVFRADVPSSKKQAYDLASLICSFPQCQPVEETVANARQYYSRSDLRSAAQYLDLIQQRQDFQFDDAEKATLKRLMVGAPSRIPRRAPANC